MEIKEIVSYFLNSDSNILEVSFKTIDDDDEVLRTDNIDYTIVGEYGFDLETESFDFFSDEMDNNDEFKGKNSIELNEDELTSFLNEYYTINSNLLPRPKFY